MWETSLLPLQARHHGDPAEGRSGLKNWVCLTLLQRHLDGPILDSANFQYGKTQ